MTIAELLTRQGDIAAQGYRESGRIAGTLASQLGAIPGQAIAGYQQAKQQKLQNDLGQAQLDDRAMALADRQKAQSAQKAIDDLMKSSMTTDPDTGLVTYDRNKLTAGFAQSGLGPMPENITKALDNADASLTKFRAAHAESIKHVAALVDAAGNDATVFQNEIQRGIQNKQFTAQEVQPYLDAVQRDPTHVGKLTQAILHPGEERKLMEFDPTKNYGDAGTGQIVVQGTGPKAPNSKESEFQLDGKGATVKGDYVPGENGQPGKYFYQGQDVTGRATKAPTEGATGDMSVSEPAMKFASEMALSGVNVQSIVPSFSGKSGAQAKAKFIEDLAKRAGVLGLTGHDVAAIMTDSKAKQSAYTTLQKTGVQTVVNESNAKKNFAQLQGLAEKADASVLTTSSALLNDWIRTGAMDFSGQSDDVRNFANVLKSALTEYAKVVSGATTGAGVTEAANAQAQALLSKGITAKTLASFRVQAEKEMANRTSSYDDALKGLFGNIKDAGTGAGGGGLGAGSDKTVALPPTSAFTGKPAGDYPATGPDGKTITVHWDGKTVTAK